MRTLIRKSFALWGLLLVTLVLPGTASAQGDQYGYDNGFFLRSADDDFMLKFNGLLKFFEGYAINDGAADTNSLAFRNARFGFSGNAFGPAWTYEMEVEMAAGAVTLLDAWGNYMYSDAFNFKFGQYKIPYSREFLTNPGNLQTVARLINPMFSFNGREYGVSLWGSLMDKMFEYYVSVSNGNGINSINTPAGSDVDFRYTGRFTVHLLGNHGLWYSDLNRSEETHVAWGGGVNYNRIDFDSDADDDDVLGLTTDLAVASNGFSGVAEFHYLRRDINGGGDTSDIQVLLNLGYMVTPKVEVALHGSWMDPDSTPRVIMGGPTINYFIHGQNARFSLQYDLVNTDAAGGQTNDHQVTGQLQFWI